MYLFPNALPFFIQIWVSDLYHFLSLWRSSFNFSCKAGLLAINSLNFCLSEEVFLLHFRKIISLSWWLFFSLIFWIFHSTTFFLACFLRCQMYLLSLLLYRWVVPHPSHLWLTSGLFLIFDFLKFEWLGVQGDIYPAWCSLTFLDL